MVAFYILLTLVFLITLVICLIVLSTLQIKICNLKIDTRLKNKIDDRYLIEISLKLFKKIKWIKIKINNEIFEKIRKNKRIDKIKFEIISNILKDKKNFKYINQMKVIKKLDINLKQLKFYINFETEDANFTSYTVAILSTIIAILIQKSIDKFEKEKYEYRITPKYGYTNFLNISLNCIINIEIVHIINVIYTILRKRSESKYARTSNRGSYDYSNE